VVGVVALAYLAQWYSHWDLITLRTSDVYIFRGGGDLVRNGEPLYDYRFWAGYWTYPPFGAVVMTPLTVIPLGLLFPLWTGLSAVALLVVIKISFAKVLNRIPAHRTRRLVLLGLAVVAVTMSPVSNALGLGQLGIILTAMCLVDAVVLLGRRSRWTGVLIGLATAVKLTPGLFIVYFLLRRQWREAAISVSTILGCWLFAAVVAWDATRDYFAGGILLRTASRIDMDGIEWMNQSIYGSTDRLADGVGQLGLYVVLSLITLAVGMGFAVRLGNEENLLAAATLVGLTSVLCSPVAWLHHGIWVLPALGVIAGAGRSRVRLVAALILFVGLALPAAAAHSMPGFSDWFVLLYVLLTLGVIVAASSRTPSAASEGVLRP
jgi:alpha-1,2-mannosyltransferase